MRLGFRASARIFLVPCIKALRMVPERAPIRLLIRLPLKLLSGLLQLFLKRAWETVIHSGSGLKAF